MYMSSNTNTCHVPTLRFPEFEGEWKERFLGDSFEERTEKNRDDLPLLSLGEEGLVLQSDTERKDNSNADKSKYLRVSVDDIAYNTMRMWQGRCVYANIEGIVSPAYTVCKPKEGIDSLFHYYLFKTKKMINLFHKNSQGLVSDTLNLKYEAFSKIEYYLPPTLAEQKKIAECLSSIDKLIAVQLQKVDAMKEKKKGLIQQLFPQDGATTPHIRFPGFTREWEDPTIAEVFDVRNGYTPSKRIADFWEGGTIPWFRMEDIRENGGILTDSIQHITPQAVKGSGLFKKNSIILATTATIGVHAMIIADSLANQRFTNFSIRKSLIHKYSPDFVYYSFFGIDEWCKNNTNAGGLLSVNMPALMKQHFMTPSLEEQKSIASCLSSLDGIVQAENDKLEALLAYKKGLMQQLCPDLS